MRVHDARVSHDKGTARLMASRSTRAQRPGLGSWLALLITGICVLVWVRNEQVVVWLLSQGIVGEGVTRSIPGALRWASVATAIVGLTAAWRIIMRSILGAYRWKPVRTFADRFLDPLVGRLRSLASGATHALGRLLILLLRPLGLGVATVALAVIGVARSFWSGVSSVARAIALVLGYLWRGVTTVASAAGQALYRLGIGVRETLLYVRLPVVAVLTFLLMRAISLLHFVWSVATATARALATALGYARSGASTVLRSLRLAIATFAHAAGLALYRLGMGVRKTLLYVRVPVVAAHAVEPGDCFMLCTDGLTSMVSEDTIRSILESELPLRACKQLIEAANSAGGLDNVTVVVMKFTP